MSDPMQTVAELRITRIFDAPRDEVFRAWTDPAVLVKWWHKDPDWTTPVAEVDLRVGGRYRLGMAPLGAPGAYVVGGVYREIEQPSRLVFTWKWENEEGPEMVVSIDFRETGDRTEIVLVHDGFPVEELRSTHAEGWKGVLDRLEETLVD